MIDVERVIAIHEVLIKRHGGSSVIRDINLLKSALERPFSCFGESEFYPTIEEKSAALLESIITNHPFIDGNKRIGYTLMRLLLMENQKDIRESKSEKYDFIIQIASGKINYIAILAWIRSKVITT